MKELRKPLFALAIFALAGLSAIWWFWPVAENESAKAQTVVAFLQYLSALLLIFVTYHVVHSQNRGLQLRGKMTSIAPQNGEVVIQFELAVANPNSRATSLRLVDLLLNGQKPKNVSFYVNGTVEAVTIAAGGFGTFTVDARFQGMPFEPGTQPEIVIDCEDIFLGPISVKWQ
jgi:hypothetical protein